MESLRLKDIAALLDAPLHGEDIAVRAVGTDSRKLAEQSLFVALTGPRFDGHDFVASARAAGARAALVQREGDWGLPYLVVPDTRHALGRIATLVRERSRARVVGITGSNGKTTVKEMTAAILRQAGETLYTEGNLNNDIGVPLTLFRLESRHAFAVVEMGANHAGEIAYLAGLARPDVGLVNNAGPAHLEGFGSLDGVARAKGEMFSNLPSHATAVINADDRYAPLWRRLAGARRVVEFGTDARTAAVAARALGAGRFTLVTPAGEAEVRLPLPGRHNVMNALAAAAVAVALELPLAAIVAGLESVPAVKGRLARVVGFGGATVIDDTYNANPSSLKAGLEVLAAEPGRRLLVLGDMAELGVDAERLHAEAGDWARAAGVARVFTVGRLARLAAERFGGGGEAFDDKTKLIAALEGVLAQDMTVLVKGSRSMAMEQVVAALTARSAEAEA